MFKYVCFYSTLITAFIIIFPLYTRVRENRHQEKYTQGMRERGSKRERERKRESERERERSVAAAS